MTLRSLTFSLTLMSTMATVLTLAVAAVPDLTTPAEACGAIVAVLDNLAGGTELVATRDSGKTWKALYDECDPTDRFAGHALPTHAGKPLRYSTDCRATRWDRTALEGSCSRPRCISGTSIQWVVRCVEVPRN